MDTFTPFVFSCYKLKKNVWSPLDIRTIVIPECLAKEFHYLLKCEETNVSKFNLWIILFYALHNFIKKIQFSPWYSNFLEMHSTSQLLLDTGIIIWTDGMWQRADWLPVSQIRCWFYICFHFVHFIQCKCKWHAQRHLVGLLKTVLRHIMSFFFFPHIASDEPGPEGKDHLHSWYGLRSNGPPWGHPAERHPHIWRGAAQAGMMQGGRG